MVSAGTSASRIAAITRSHCAAGLGARKESVRPSCPIAVPRMAARTRSPSFNARSKGLSSTATNPSARTNPLPR